MARYTPDLFDNPLSLGDGETLSQNLDNWLELSDEESSMLSKPGNTEYVPQVSLGLDTDGMEDELATDISSPRHGEDGGYELPLKSQIGGGRRPRTPPPIIYPTRLRTRINPTKVDQGLIRDASARRSRLPESGITEFCNGEGGDTLGPQHLASPETSNTGEQTPITENILPNDMGISISEGFIGDTFSEPPKASTDAHKRPPRDSPEPPRRPFTGPFVDHPRASPEGVQGSPRPSPDPFTGPPRPSTDPFAGPPRASPDPFAGPPRASPDPFAGPPRASPDPFARPPQASRDPFADPPQASPDVSTRPLRTSTEPPPTSADAFARLPRLSADAFAGHPRGLPDGFPEPLQPSIDSTVGPSQPSTEAFTGLPRPFTDVFTGPPRASAHVYGGPLHTSADIHAGSSRPSPGAFRDPPQVSADTFARRSQVSPQALEHTRRPAHGSMDALSRPPNAFSEPIQTSPYLFINSHQSTLPEMARASLYSFSNDRQTPMIAPEPARVNREVQQGLPIPSTNVIPPTPETTRTFSFAPGNAPFASNYLHPPQSNLWRQATPTTGTIFPSRLQRTSSDAKDIAPVSDIPAEPHVSIYNESVPPIRATKDPQTISDDKDVPDEDHIQSGRISDQNNKLLEEGFRKLDNILASIADETGLPCKQIVLLWEKRSKPTASNFHPWRAYGSYFRVNQEEELRRIETELNPGDELSPDVRARCYEEFKKTYPDRWKQILKKHDEAQLYTGGTTTMSGRSQLFTKTYKSLKQVAETNAARYGFEMAFILAGNAINQDHSLTEVHTTAGAKNFFALRLRQDNNALIGHFKTHIYDHVSHQQIVEQEEDTNTVEPAEVHAVRSTNKKEPEGTDMAGDDDKESVEKLDDQDLDLIRKLMTSQLSKPSNEHLRTVCLIVVAERAGGKWPTKLLPGKKLADQLAKQAMVLINYPENVRLPGEESNGKRSKGIADLNKQERVDLIDALRDKEYPLCFIGAPKYRQDLIKSRKPSIIGIPPSPNSQHDRGRRRFSNGITDRQGLLRLSQPSAAMNSKGKGRAGTVSHEALNPPGPTSTRRSRKGKVIKSAAVVSSDDAAADEDESRNDSSSQSDGDGDSEGAGKRKRRHKTSDENGQAAKKSRGNTVEESILVGDSSSSDDASPGSQRIITRSKGKGPHTRNSDNIMRKKGVRFVATSGVDAPTTKNKDTEPDKNGSVPARPRPRPVNKSIPEASAKPRQEHSEASDEDMASSLAVKPTCQTSDTHHDTEPPETITNRHPTDDAAAAKDAFKAHGQALSAGSRHPGSRHRGLAEPYQEHLEASMAPSTHLQETLMEVRTTQPHPHSDASTPVAPQLSERTIGQRLQDQAAGTHTVQGREGASDARTQPTREHHGGPYSRNTEQWGRGQGEAELQYLGMGGWNSPISHIPGNVGRSRRGYPGGRYPIRIDPQGHSPQLGPPLPIDVQGHSPRPLPYSTPRMGYQSMYPGRQPSSGFMYDAPDYYNEEYYHYNEYDPYHEDRRRPAMHAGGLQDHTYVWTPNDSSQQVSTPEARSSRSPNAAAGPSRFDERQ